MEGHSEGRGHNGVRKLVYFSGKDKKEKKEMGACGNPDSDLCNPNCGTLDCHNYGCVINNSNPPNANSGKPKSKVVEYYRWAIPVGISEDELDKLATEISSEKKIDKIEVIQTVKSRLNQFNSQLTNPMSVGA